MLVVLFGLSQKKRKKESQGAHDCSRETKISGLKAKVYHKQCCAEKIQMKNTIKMHKKENTNKRTRERLPQGEVLANLRDREARSLAEVLSSMIKYNKRRKQENGKTLLSRVCSWGETEVLKFIWTGKKKQKPGKRTVAKVGFVENGFTWKPLK